MSIPELNFASSTLGLLCRSDGKGCESLLAPELNKILSTWKPIYLPVTGCACFPGAAGGGNPGDLCFRPSDEACQIGDAGIDVCHKAWLWCASQQCAVPQGQLWGVCL